MDATFWRVYGGLKYAPRPDLATCHEQNLVAYKAGCIGVVTVEHGMTGIDVTPAVRAATERITPGVGPRRVDPVAAGSRRRRHRRAAAPG